MVPIGCPETSVRNYHYSPRNNPEERSSHLMPSCAYCNDKEGSTGIVPLNLSPGSTDELSASRSVPFALQTELRHPFKWKLGGPQSRSGHKYFTCLETRKSPTKLPNPVLPALSLLAIPTDNTTGSSGFVKFLSMKPRKHQLRLSQLSVCVQTGEQNGGLREFSHSTGFRMLGTSTWDGRR
jgi:hypothetical protein